MYFFTVGNSKILIFAAVKSKRDDIFYTTTINFLSFFKEGQKKLWGTLKLTEKWSKTKFGVSWWVREKIKQLKFYIKKIMSYDCTEKNEKWKNVFLVFRRQDCHLKLILIFKVLKTCDLQYNHSSWKIRTDAKKGVLLISATSKLLFILSIFVKKYLWRQNARSD
jgi:hypothetical protein